MRKRLLAASVLLASAPALSQYVPPRVLDFYENGTFKGTRPAVNFSSGATLTDDSANNRMGVSVSGGAGASVDDTAYDATTWDGVTTIAPSKNAVRDKVETLVTGPASSTSAAIPKFSGTGGKTLLNTNLLLDETAMGAGTTTIKPTTGATSRTFTLPDKDGTPLINNVSDTLGTTLFAESNQWFNNADTSKRMKFDLSSVGTGRTVTLKPASGAGNVTITFPSSSSTLAKNSGDSLSRMAVIDDGTGSAYFDWSDNVASVEPGSPGAGTQTIRQYNYSNDLYFKRDDGTKVSVFANLLPSDTAYNATSWDGVTTQAPSKNAVRDEVETLVTSIASKESSITAGTSSQYWRGDKTFQTLNTTAVAEGTNLYYTDARAIAAPLTGYTAGAGAISSSDTIKGAIQKLAANQQVLRLSSNFTTTSTSSLNTALSFTAAANEVWHLRFQGTAQCSSTGGVKYQVTAPTGASVEGWLYSSTSAITTLSYQRFTAINTLSGTATHTVATTPSPDVIDVIVVNGGSSGTVAIGAASVTSGQTTTIFANSSLVMERL